MGETLHGAARRVRDAMLAGMRGAGGFRSVAASSWRRRRLLILCYHGVSLKDEHDWNAELFVTPAFLRRRFEILRDGGYAVLPLGDAVRGLRQGSLPPRSVVLTFDDGFYNFYAAAVPLLEEFGFPATNYVSSYYCVHQHPLPNLALRYLLWCARGQVLAAGALPGQDSAVDLGDPRQRAALARRLWSRMEATANGREERLTWLSRIAGLLGLDWEAMMRSRLLHLMTSAELAEVARRGFDVQLHTHRHRTPRDKALFCAEVLENRRILEGATGRPATHFCYPSGDTDPAFLPWLREVGVETATAGINALARNGDDPLMLPRFVDTMAQSEMTFEAWLAGVRGLLQLRRA